jgi:hypothetical protein
MSEPQPEQIVVQRKSSGALLAINNVSLILNLLALTAICVFAVSLLPRLEQGMTKAELPVAPLLAAIAQTPPWLTIAGGVGIAAVLIVAHVALRRGVGGLIFASFATLTLAGAVVLFWVAVVRSVVELADSL